MKFKRNKAIGGGGGKIQTDGDVITRDADIERGPLYSEVGSSRDSVVKVMIGNSAINVDSDLYYLMQLEFLGW